MMDNGQRPPWLIPVQQPMQQQPIRPQTWPPQQPQGQPQVRPVEVKKAPSEKIKRIIKIMIGVVVVTLLLMIGSIVYYYMTYVK